ncbi:MAG: hypothetical protein ABII82_18400 [Verrucomicrobiota bacterium]
MATVTKTKKAAKRSVARPVRVLDKKPRLTPLPTAKGTTKDLLSKVDTFGEGIDMGLVIKAVESRSSRRR